MKGTGNRIVVISMLAVAIAIFLFLLYQVIAFYHYKSVVLDRFPVEPPSKEEKRFFEVEKERKEQAIEMAKKYARGKDDLYGDPQNIAEKVKGDVKIIGWNAEKALHAGLLYDPEKYGARFTDDFKGSMDRIKKGLIKLKNLGFLTEGSPSSELLIENEPKYFASKIKRLKEEYVSIQFYLIPKGKGMVKAKDLSEEAKKVVDEIDKEIDKAEEEIHDRLSDSAFQKLLHSFRHLADIDEFADVMRNADDPHPPGFDHDEGHDCDGKRQIDIRIGSPK